MDWHQGNKMERLPHSCHSTYSSWLKVTSFFGIFMLALTTFNGVAGSCFQDKNKNFLGQTYPSGDIVLHVGEPLELFCSINLENAQAKNFTIDNLAFARDSELVDGHYVTRVNETTIRLNIDNKEESNHMYYCYLITNATNNLSSSNINSNSISSLEMSTVSGKDKSLRQTLVCMNLVAVGKEPKEVENFTCISYNLQQLKCTWDVPKNFVKTTYTIQYMPRHRNHREAAPCPNDDDINNNSCTWTLSTKPIYRINFDFLKFNITGVNKFNKTEQTFPFQHFAHVLPEEPKELRLLNKTTTSILLQWDIGDLQYFAKNWTYKILYKHNGSEWFTFMCDPKNVIKDRSAVSCNVINLIPNTLYNFRVYMKSSIASEKLWSEKFASQLFWTNASPPKRSPKTDIGSFQIDTGLSVRIVYIYWEQLMSAEYCGDNFHYMVEVFVVDEKENELSAPDVKRLLLNHSYAKYEIGSSTYKFVIRSANVMGVAPNVSHVIVPATDKEVKLCGSFTKTDYGNSIYEVSWQPPPNEQNIVNYTIFWCQTERERPYQCDGFTQWIHLPASETKHNFSINSTNSYQFAISANTQYSSSGMLWATCTVLHGHLGTIKHVYASYEGSTYINVAWKLECWDQASTIIGFGVNYCPTSAHNDTRCTEAEQNVTWWGDAHHTSGNITDLKPFTYYKVSIHMFTKELKGAPSTPVIFRTTDGSPLVDGLHTWVVNRTNTSATIQWEMPKVMNGIFKEYKVELSLPGADPVTKRITENITQTTLTNLSSYTNYSVAVRACTTSCSNPMPSVTFRTRIGVPDMPVIDTSSQLKGADEGEVCWNPPTHLSGPHPIYELAVLKDDKLIYNKTVSNGTCTMVSLPECTGDKGAGLYSLKVRAINVDDEIDVSNNLLSPLLASALLHIGPWSSVYAQNCNFGGLSTTWKVLACIFFPLFFAVVFIYGGRKSIYKCKQMKSVQVTIPMKFSLAPSSVPSDARGHDLFGPPFRPADEFSNLVDQTTEQAV